MLRIFTFVLSALLVLGSTGFAQAASAKGEGKKTEARDSGAKEKKGSGKSSEKSKDKTESKGSKTKSKAEGKDKSEAKGKSKDKADKAESKSSKGGKADKSSKSDKRGKAEGKKGKKGKGRHGKSAEPDAEAPGQASYLNYKVAPGDTLAKVAEAHGVSAEAIASLNGDQDVKNLIPGKTLRVPKPQKSIKADGPLAPQPSERKAGASPAAVEAENLFEKGNDYGKKNDFASAIATFDQAIKLNPNKSEYFSSRGHANYYLKKYDAAVADYTKAIEIDPKQALPYNMRGLSHVRQNRFEDALADFNQAIRINPKDVDFYKGRGYAYYNLKRTEDMCRDYAKACELGDCELLEKTKNDQLCK